MFTILTHCFRRHLLYCFQHACYVVCQPENSFWCLLSPTVVDSRSLRVLGQLGNQFVRLWPCSGSRRTNGRALIRCLSTCRRSHLCTTKRAATSRLRGWQAAREPDAGGRHLWTSGMWCPPRLLSSVMLAASSAGTILWPTWAMCWLSLWSSCSREVLSSLGPCPTQPTTLHLLRQTCS